jgi:hypothetical protein
MLHNNYEINVLVKGRPINEYSHNGQVFIEGRDSSAFEIEFKNRSAVRIEAVISVDGLSVIDGKDAGPASSGYLVEPFQSVRIPGWKLTDEQVAAFVFAGKKKSYAQESTGTARNTGVIGALVFAEKSRTPAYHSFGGGAFHGGLVRGMTPMGVGGWAGGGSTGDPVFGAALNNVQLTGHVSNNMAYSTDAVATASMTSSATASTVRSKSKGVRAMVLENTAPEVEQTLGTAFGKAQDFATTEVQFNRGDLAAMIVVYYDDSRGLRARGIELSRPSKQRLARANQPQAFPGMSTGCVPPAGWKG